MSKHIIAESVASGEEIAAIIASIEPTLEGVKRGHGIIALLSLTLVLMNPEILPEELQEGVRNVSQYICLLLDSNNRGEGKELAN